MKPTDYDAILPAPIGTIGVSCREGRLRRLEFLPPGTALRAATDPLSQRVAMQLAAYFADADFAFDLPLEPLGSPFRLRVWQALPGIPRGQTESYGQLAHRLGSAARAVGQALGDNPLPIVIPCHRVIAAGRRLGGFNHSQGGFALEMKRWLLRHEGAL